MRIRDAVEADLPAIVAMYADDELGVTREEPADPLPEEYRRAFAAIRDDPRHRLVVAEEDEGAGSGDGSGTEAGGGALLATLQLSFLPHLVRRGGERAQIEAVRVAAGRRGGGVGRELVGWAVAAARARGCVLVQLTTDAARPDARRFYESLGFAAGHVGLKLPLR